MSSKALKGIVLEIGGDTTKLDKALSGVNKESRNIQKELKEVDKALKLDPKNTELVAQKQKLLADNVKATSEKLDVLKKAEAQAQEQFAKGEISEEQYRALQREIVKTEAELEALSKAANESQSTMSKISDVTGKVGEKSTALGKKLMPVTVAIGAIGTVGVAAFNELDTGYDTIISKTGATGDALEDMQDIMDNLFTSLPIEAEAAGIAVGEVNTRFDVTGKELENLSAKFLKFAEINGSDVNQSIQLVSRAMGDAGIASDQAGNVMDWLTVTAQKSGISIEKLTENVTKYGAPMRQLGFETKESIAIFGAWEKAGVNTEIAFSGMKKAISNWAAEGKDAKVEFQKTLEEIKSAPDIASATTKAIEIFGAKAGPDLADAIQGGRFEFEDYVKAIEEGGGSVENTFEAMQDPPDKAKIALNNLKLVAADLGAAMMSVLAPVLEKVVEKVKNFTEWFGNLSQSQKETIVKIGALVAAIAPALLIFGKLSTGISTITGGLAKLSGGFKLSGTAGKGLFAILKANPIGLVLTAITGLVAGFVLMYNKCEWFRDLVQSAFSSIKESISAAIKKIKPTLESIGETLLKIADKLQPVFEFIIALLVGVISGVAAALSPILDAVQSGIDFIYNLVSGIIALFKGDFSAAGDFFKSALGNILGVIKSLITAAFTFVAEFFKTFGVDIGKVFTNIWEGIKNVFTTIGQWFTDRFKEAYNGIVNVFKSIGTWFSNRYTDIKNVFMAIATWFGDRFRAAYTAVTNAFNAIGTWFSNKYTAIKNVFTSVATWFGDRFKAAYSAVTGAFSSIGSFFQGIWNNVTNIFRNAGSSIGSAISGAFKGAMNGALSVVENIINQGVGLINGAIGIINKLPGVNVGSVPRVYLPRLAHGGILEEGRAMVAEAGPEIIQMVNGKTIVTPLTSSARNTALDMATGGNKGGFTQNISVTSPKALSAYEVARQARNQTRNMVAQLQRG